ncbi:hypothetical protein ONZ45_g5021 [Pleurotus djamor]|nr:hypothetical protein ONZ45_g5021 [Pleurotus djamor]
MQLNLWSPSRASSRAESPEEKEKVIIILGLTGSGKSTFINAAAGSPRIPVGHGLESATRSVCTTYIPDPTSSCSKILLAEAPAFTYEMESIRESERQLRKWVDNTL